MEETGAHGRQHPIARLAARQYGHATRDQLRALGVPVTTIEHWLRRDVLIAVHRGVYAVRYPRTEPIARAAAAVLACGPAAVLSHFSAAVLWGLATHWPVPPQVTLTAGDRRPQGIELRRSSTLRRCDVRVHTRIRATSPARTSLDIAPDLPIKALTRLINDGRRRGLIQLNTLADLLHRNPNHSGTPLLAPFVGSRTGPTRSELEDLFLAFLGAHGLPIPRINVRIAGYEVDAVFDAEKVIVELDGYAFHYHEAVFESDRKRDADTLLAGYVTIRITWRRLHDAPDQEATRLNTILQRRRRDFGLVR